MSQPVPDEVLVAAELPAVQTLLATQNRLGVTAPAFTAPGVLALMAQLDTLSSVYPKLQNATVRSWVDLLYDDLIKVTTVYKQPFPALYVAYHLATFPFAPDQESVPLKVHSPQGPSSLTLNRASGSYFLFEQRLLTFKLEYSMTAAPTNTQVAASNQTFPVAQYGVYPAFRQTCTLLYDQVVTVNGEGISPNKAMDEGTAQGSITRSPWCGPPAAPPCWNRTLNDLLTTWAMQPPTAVIPLTTFDNWANVQGAILDPTNWTDVENVRAGAVPVWAAQVAQVRAMLQSPTLTAGNYFFLLHVLIGLLTGDAQTATLVERIVAAPADSTEYPNDTFINQLIYLALMYLADPQGAYAWDNAQLQQVLAQIGSLVENIGPAAPLILTSLARHQKLLYTDSSYPLVDPYSPSIGFTQRVTDTLFALDKARAALGAT